MRTVKIGDREFTAREHTQAEGKRYLNMLESYARTKDKPMVRLLKKLEGVEGKDRTDAIAALIAKPDWDKPPASLVNAAATEPYFLVQLCVLRLVPRLTEEEFYDLIGDNCLQVYSDIMSTYKPISDAEIIEGNKALKERIKQQAQNAKPPE